MWVKNDVILIEAQAWSSDRFPRSIRRLKSSIKWRKLLLLLLLLPLSTFIISQDWLQVWLVWGMDGRETTSITVSGWHFDCLVFITFGASTPATTEPAETKRFWCWFTWSREPFWTTIKWHTRVANWEFENTLMESLEKGLCFYWWSYNQGPFSGRTACMCVFFSRVMILN